MGDNNHIRMLTFALPIFVSAFLLFLVQPIIGKQILPWFGGSAAVWSTCLVFFQLALLAGYFYSDWTTRRLSFRWQAIVHFGLIVIALAMLPIVPDASWKPQGSEQPSVRILLLLTITIGLPYFILSTTSPLLQAWIARAHPGASPYRLFSLSNLASLLALLSYPFLVEPQVTTRHQAMVWSVGFGVFALLMGIALWRAASVGEDGVALTTSVAPSPATAPPTSLEKITWVALAALGSILLLGVSNHLTQNISSLPLLWVLPLALYLLSFILCFNSRSATLTWYPRWLSLPLTALAVCVMAWLLADKRRDFMLLLHIAVFSSGLLIACMFCHGELAARKPAARFLTQFYLMVASGGALGSLLIGILAPLILPANYDLGFALYALAALAAWLLWSRLHWIWRSVSVAVCVFTLCSCIYAVIELRADVVTMSRNFYGTLRVKEYVASNSSERMRFLMHGIILHGDQFLDPALKRAPTTYYQHRSGIGLALLQKETDLGRPRRVGIVGLGAGTLAAYGNKGDVFRFYEINPRVVEIAQRDFTYLKDTAATIEIALGDARLSLEREAPQRFDVLAIDAFSSDSIPVHLLTVEALEVYEKQLQVDGIVAFHVSNRYLDLHPVVQALADARGFAVAWIREVRDDSSVASDWVLLCKNKNVLREPAIAAAALPITPRPDWRLWTDDFNNLVQVLK